MLCIVETLSWATNTGPFLQHLNETTSSSTKARLLHCTQHLEQKNVHYVQRINTYVMTAPGSIESKV